MGKNKAQPDKYIREHDILKVEYYPAFKHHYKRGFSQRPVYYI
jgi:hypothetical protein